MEQTGGVAGFEVAPKLIGSAQERYVGGVLVVGEPDDARDAVGRAAVVRNVEALEAQAFFSTPGEVVEGSAAHATYSEHDRVIAIRHYLF